jgi:hypothetical protein
VNASAREAAAKTVNVRDSGLGVTAGGTVVGMVDAPQAVKKMDSKRARESRRFMEFSFLE